MIGQENGAEIESRIRLAHDLNTIQACAFYPFNMTREFGFPRKFEVTPDKSHKTFDVGCTDFDAGRGVFLRVPPRSGYAGLPA